MQLKYSGNLIGAVDGMQKVSGLTWSSNGKKLACCTADRVRQSNLKKFKSIQLYDDQGGKKDKFPTKPSDKGQKSYVIRTIEFSPDSTKIAVAQSDNIVYVYKVGQDWGDKKTICNKFPASSSVTCLTWPKDRANDLVFGLAEGKVKVGVLKNNKSQVAFSTESYVVSIASNREGDTVISGHLDGSIYCYNMDSQQSQKLVVHHSIPYALAFGEQIAAAGSDQKVSFYDNYGNLLQRFDYSSDDKCREFTTGAASPNGDTIVLGNFNRFYVYNYNQKRNQWEEIGVKHIENYYSVTAVCWKNDSSRLVIASLCGSVDMFDISMKKIRYKGKFDLNYIGPSQIVIQVLQNGQKAVVRSQTAEINKVDIQKDRYAVARTHETLIVCDIQQNKQSEVPWRGGGNEKFDFSNENICMIFNAGELTLIEYGNNEPLGTCRTEHMKNSLISAKISYLSQGQATKVIAFLLDLQTLQVQDLSNQTIICTISHDSKIDFLELNARANKLLFRDKRRQLYLYNLKTSHKSTLLSYCNYAQWVPDSEVVVAQNRGNLCVWYSIDNPDKVTLYTIKGDVEEIERSPGKTEVIVNEGNTTVAYQLDEPLIEFGFSVEQRDLDKAATILDPLEMTQDTEANWKVLAQIALEEQNLSVSEHCYSALGDMARAAYLRKINKIIYNYEQETGRKDGINFYKVQARLAVLDKQFARAEQILLDHNGVEDAMEMYQELHKWDESIKIAERKGHPQVRELKDNYFSWLMETGQEEKAAELKESEGDFINAISLYLKGGLPAKAANVVFNYNMSFPQDLLEKIASALASSGMFEKAGEFYEQMENDQQSLNCYCKGNAYKKAIELAKRKDPKLVQRLEESWAEYLVNNKETESAINHFVEAGKYQKAIEAAISSRQWTKAIQLLGHQTPEVARSYYRQIAKHYEDIRQYDFAEKYYLKANQAIEAFEMYVKASKWEQALKVARENLPENEIVSLYIKQGLKFESQGKFKEAEKLYLTVEEPDKAIQMYYKQNQYDNVVRLVQKFLPQKLKDTHLQIAQRMEKEGQQKRAETHYIEGGAWHMAVQMYRQSNQWEEAIRCCKLYGSEKETCQLAKQWAESLGPETGLKMLMKMNLVDALIEYLSDRNEFDEAFKMANQHARHKLQDVHMKYACFLEDEKRYKEAEENFIKAGKPSEAINMYEHLGDFHNALQVARQYEPSAVQAIQMNQAKFFIDRRDFPKAENCFIQAKKPELAIKMYTDMGNFPEALKVAKQHAPHLVPELNNKYMNQATSYSMSGEELFNSAMTWEDSRDYLKAIEIYLDIKPQNTQSEDLMKKAWERAVQLASTFDKERAPKIVLLVCKRFKEIKKFENAAYLYEQLGQYEDAVACYVQGKEFEKAKQCAGQINNRELNAKLMDLIVKSQKQHAQQSGHAESMVDLGDVQAALDMLAQRNEWAQCLQLAEKQGGEVLNRYLMRYEKLQMQGGKFGEAIAILAKYGMQPIPANYTLYRNLVQEIFVDCEPKEIANLRITLYRFMQSLESTGESNQQIGHEFNRYLVIAHLLYQKQIYFEKGLAVLHARTCISLLRYCDLVRLDQVYLEAGEGAKKMNWLNFAFVLLNRYLDIYEVIEDPNNNNLGDNSDFQNTDIPSPYDVPLPEKNLINDQKKEELRDWLLQMSINQKVEQILPSKPCDKCGKQMYEAALRCNACKQQYEPCVITGYPLFKGTIFNCQSCGKGGLKEYWNTYLQAFANCPWCNSQPK